MSPRPDEVIVVDGGSIDGTPEIAAHLGATVVHSKPGRGTQIAAGVAETQADVVLVLHADSELAPDTASRILAALNARPRAIGGAVGQRFDCDALRLCVIEPLNEARFVLLSLSFGDQGQFFRRATIMASGGFPELRLMEDVELSLRLRAMGPMLYLGEGLVCSGRRWQKENWLKRCVAVITMTTIYRIRRREGAQIADILYRRYYPAAARNTQVDFTTADDASLPGKPFEGKATHTGAKTTIREQIHCGDEKFPAGQLETVIHNTLTGRFRCQW